MRPYAQFCPMSKAAEVLGDRWTLLILRDMVVLGSTRFNEIARGLPGLSRALLSKRLAALQQKGIVTRHGREYLLTDAGRELAPIITAFGEWGAKFAFSEPEPEELDPDLLLWWMHTRIDRDQIPDDRVVVEFEFSDTERRYWLVIEPGDVSICLTHPGMDTDVLVRSDLATLYRVWNGRLDLHDAMRDDQVRLAGASPLVSSFPRWLELSPLAPAVRAARERSLA